MAVSAGNRARRSAWRAAALALTVIVGACGIADRKARGEALVDSVSRVEATSTASAELHQSLTFVKLPPEISGSVPGLKAGFTTPETTSPLALNFADHLASAAVTTAKGVEPVQIFADTKLFQRRLADNGQPVGDARSWQGVDLGHLYYQRKQNQHTSVGSNLLNATYVVELLRGALTGSVKERGTETIRGVPTRHFTLNVAPAKAFQDASDARERAITAGFALMGVGADVLPAEAWLDPEGRPRRIKVALKQARSRHDVLRLNITLDLFDFGSPISVRIPRGEALATVDNVAALGTSRVGSLLSANAAAGLTAQFSGLARQFGPGAAPTTTVKP